LCVPAAGGHCSLIHPAPLSPPAVQLLAEVLLLQAALRDPLNQRFVLLSESCTPLYPAASVYVQLMGEGRSRVNTCPVGDVRDKEQ